MDADTLSDAALVISECQRGIIDPERSMLPGLAEQVAQRDILPRIARLADAFRRAGRPVVHCHVAHRPDLAGVVRNSLLGASVHKHRRMLQGSEDVEPMPPVIPHPEDLVSCRAVGLTAFYGTDLDAMLRLTGVRTLVVTGVSTDLAVLGLAIDAVNRGYFVRIPVDCTAGSTADHHALMVHTTLAVLARPTTAQDVLDRLGSAAGPQV